MGRYDLTDLEWRVIAPLLPNKPRGVPRVDDRRVLNGILWVLRSGAPWRDLPERYGPYTTCYNRFNRWRKKGVWDRLMDAVAQACDGNVQMIDSSSVRVHQHAAGAKKGVRIVAGEHIASGEATRVGLVATNSIRCGANRRALQAATDGRPIFDAWSDEPWVIDGAAVRVSLVCFSRADDTHKPETRVDGEPADEIHSDLSATHDGAGINLTGAKRISANIGVAFIQAATHSPDERIPLTETNQTDEG